MILNNLYFGQYIWIYSCYNLPAEPVEYAKIKADANITNRILGDVVNTGEIKGVISKTNQIGGAIN